MALGSDAKRANPLETGGLRGHTRASNNHTDYADCSGAARRATGAMEALSALFQRLGADTLRGACWQQDEGTWFSAAEHALHTGFEN